MDFLAELKERVKNGKNCVNLGREILATNKPLHEWVISKTPWIPSNHKFNERVYCILNDIHGNIIDAWGEIAKFGNLFTGYLLRQTSFDKNQSGLKNAAILEEKRRLALLVPKKTKIDRLAAKYRKKYPELYLALAIKDYDYKECPVTGIRLKMITSDYITNILDMSVEEFDRLYPGVRGSCQERLDKVKESLKEIDPATGLNKHALSVKKSKIILSAVDENGLRGYDRKGQKTRATHMANVDEYGRNGYSQLATKAIIKGNQTKANNGLISQPSEKGLFHRYKSIVHYITSKHKKQIAEGYKLGLAGTKNAWQIDHMFSVFHGYTEKISPLAIGHINNLKVLPWEINLAKHTDSSMSRQEFLIKVGYTENRAVAEYNFFMDEISKSLNNNESANSASLIEKFYGTELYSKYRI